MQEVNFTYEIIIHDDASTDKTQDVIKELIDKNPSKVFRSVLRTENHYSKSGVLFLKEVYQMTKGKYVAVCEGDDFWIDSTKLQRQVDFLENNQEYALVFHPVKVVFQDGEEPDYIFPETASRSQFKLENLLKTNFIHTNSVLYRHQEYERINPNVMPIDWYMHLFHAQLGKIGYIDRTMSVYRRHHEGIWWEATHQARDEIWKKHGAGHMVLYAEMLKMFGDKAAYRLIIDSHIEGTVNILNRIDNSAKTHLMADFVEKFPEFSSPLLLSLSRTTYKNYELLEKNNEIQERKLQEMIEKTNILERERADIINSTSYKVGSKLAHVSSIVRRSHEK